VTEQDVERLINYKLERFRTHPEWPDIQQEARIAAWKALEKTRGEPWAPSTVVCKAAAWAAAEYLRYRVPGGQRCHEPVCFEMKEQDGSPVDLVAAGEWNRCIWEGGELCRTVFAGLPKRYARLFVRHYFEEIKQMDLALEEGVNWSRVYQILSLCRNAFRREAGLPEQGYSETTVRERRQKRNQCPVRRAKGQAYRRELYARRKAERER
jgi:DNA-directed RNA polymerase specialized sigma24 family protein